MVPIQAPLGHVSKGRMFQAVRRRSVRSWLLGINLRWVAARTSRHASLSQMMGTVPPSMTYSAPLIAFARSDTRNATSSAASVGWAGRPIGMPLRGSMTRCRAASRLIPAPREVRRRGRRRPRSGRTGGDAVDAYTLRADLVRGLEHW
jgi:hypothetical protein